MWLAKDFSHETDIFWGRSNCFAEPLSTDQWNMAKFNDQIVDPNLKICTYISYNKRRC